MNKEGPLPDGQEPGTKWEQDLEVRMCTKGTYFILDIRDGEGVMVKGWRL